jgi:pimeloyl-ACP methyl ester carboxylesterase
VPLRASAASLAIAVEGGEVAAWTTGANKAALIFLHGWTLDHRIWTPQFEDGTLAARHRLVAIDRRGFGVSSAPPDLDREASDVITVMDRLSIARAVIVGQSQAGRVALRLALDHGKRIAGLVLAGAPVAGFHPAVRTADDIPVDHYRALVRAGRIDEMKALWARHAMIATTGADQALIAAQLRDYDGRDLLAAPAPPGPDIQRIGAIQIPAMVVTGARDTAWRRLVGDAMAYALPHGRRAEIPAAGHLCNVDAPARFNRLIATFAASLAG